jgi:hypothetical protein
MKKSISITALFFILLFVACNKKEKELGLSKSQLIRSGPWKLTAVVADEDGNGTYETDRFATFLPCFTDNTWSFSEYQMLVLYEGPSKCDPADP